VQKQEVPVWMARLNTEYESCRFWEKRLSANQLLAYIKAPDAYEGKWASSPFGGHDNSCMSDEPQYINDERLGGPQAKITVARGLK
jgi:hypothetical protein